jgi:hypothetical protein
MARYVISEEERETLAARAGIARDVLFQNALRDALAAGLESWDGCRGRLSHIQAAMIAHGPYITRPAPPEIGGGTPNPTSPWR